MPSSRLPDNGFEFDEVVTSFGFIENIVDQCIYLKISGSNFVILICVDDILYANNEIGMLHETKQTLFNTFEMKGLVEVSFVLGLFTEMGHVVCWDYVLNKVYNDRVLRGLTCMALHVIMLLLQSGQIL